MTQGEAQGDGARMAGWSGALLGGGAALALIVAGLIGWSFWKPQGAREAGTDPAAPPVAERAEKTAAGTSSEAAPSPSVADARARTDASTALASKPSEAAPRVQAPSDGGASASSAKIASAPVQFDALRAAPDGSVTLAGRVEPGAKIDILVDGETVAQERADGAGNFAALFDLPPSNGARALSLRVTGADGVARDSAESLVLRPAQTEIATAPESADSSAPPAAGDMAQAPPAPIVADATGARLLAPASDTLVIDTVAFGQGRRASAEGRGAPEGAKLGAYLDGKLVAQTQGGIRRALVA